MSDKTISVGRGTQWTSFEGRRWALGDDYDRLWLTLTEIAKHDSSNYSVAHRRLVKLAREALSPALYSKSQQKRFLAVVTQMDLKRFESAPCYICGYNGPNYYQPEVHRCAQFYHEQTDEMP